MTDQLTITVSGPTGSGKTSLARWIIAGLGYDRRLRRHYSLHENTADLIDKFDAVDGTPGGLEIGLHDTGSTIVIRTQDDTKDVPQPNTCGAEIDYVDILRQPFDLPPVGPLTSTTYLRPGDIVRRYTGKKDTFDTRVVGDGVTFSVGFIDEAIEQGFRFDFVARPGVWMPWSGGENPVPGMTVLVRFRSDNKGSAENSRPSPSQPFRWNHVSSPSDIIEYMVIAEPSRDVESLADLFNSGAVRPDKPGSKRLVPTEELTPQIAFDNVLNGHVERQGEPGHWRVVRTPEGVLYEVFGTLADQPLDGAKAEPPPTDAKKAVADAVRVAAKALNDAMRDARREDVMTDLSIQKLIPRGKNVVVNCTARL